MRRLLKRLLAVVIVAPSLAHAACLALTSHPDGLSLAELALPADRTGFMITYVHSVTMTPVVDVYRVAADELVETEMRFVEHGPGLPTAPDAGASFVRRDGMYIVTMDRHFPTIVMRVHRDQSPRLVVGMAPVDLAQWGNRALALGVVAGPCRGSGAS